MLRSLKAKILVPYVLLFGVVLLVATMYMSYLLRERLESQLETRIAREVDLVGDLFTHELHNVAHTDAIIKRMGNELGARLTLVDELGTVFADSEVPEEKLSLLDNHGDREEIRDAMFLGSGMSRRYSATLDRGMVYLAKKFTAPDESWFIVRASSPLLQVETTIQKTLAVLQTTAIGAFIVTLLSSLWLAAKITKPLETMTNMTQNILNGDFDTRILHYPKDEIGELGKAMDTMAMHLKSTLQRLERETNQLESVFRGMGEAVMVVNERGEIVMVNTSFERFFPKARAAEGLIASTVIRDSAIPDAIRSALEGKETFDLGVTPGGQSEGMFRVNVVPLRIDEEVSGCIAVFHDVTRLEKLEVMRKDFVANVSHELRTPLTAIKGYVETLVENPPEDPEQQRSFLKLVLKHANRMSTLTSDLLMLSSIESDKADLQVAVVQVQPVLEGARQSILQKAVAKSLTLDTACEPEDLELSIAPQSLSQILANLIENAVNYTPKGGNISVKAVKDAESVLFSVEDTGIGIPAQEKDRIFERFYRVNKHYGEDVPGTGLGLAIVKNLVQAQNGEIWVESRVGVGSAFYVRFPIESI